MNNPGNTGFRQRQRRTVSFSEPAEPVSRDSRRLSVVSSVTNVSSITAAPETIATPVEKEVPILKTQTLQTLRDQYRHKLLFGSAENAIPQPELEDTEDDDRAQRAWWRSVVLLFTCCFVDACVLPGKSAARKQAWREKVALNCLIYIFSALLLFVFAVLPLLICPNEKIYTQQDINAQRNAAWITVFGEIYDMEEYFDRHPGGSRTLLSVLGQDASGFFRRPNVSQVDSACIRPDIFTNANASLPDTSCTSLRDFSDTTRIDSLHCHNVFTSATDPLARELKTGDLAWTFDDLGDRTRVGRWTIVYDKVLNITEYLERGHNYLNPVLHSIFRNREQQDASALFAEAFPRNETFECALALFGAGVIDTRFSVACSVVNGVIFATVIIVVAVSVAKFIVSVFAIGAKDYKSAKRYVLVMVPCYTEDKASLEKTLTSIATSQYPDSHKHIVVVCDGMVKGAGQTKTTPELVLEIFGRTLADETESYPYPSLGEGPRAGNTARVFSGKHTFCIAKSSSHTVGYTVIIKTGGEAETDRPGNRGKRDSQIIILRFLHKLLYSQKAAHQFVRGSGTPPNVSSLYRLDALETRLYTDLEDASRFSLLFTVDSDTRIEPDAISKLVALMAGNARAVAVCGETRVDNKLDSWVSAIQVYEYYINHHLHKAFESLFGAVTCLPGCFSMYRIKFTPTETHGFDTDKGLASTSGSGGIPGVVHEDIIREYSSNAVDTLHTRNLFELGEDRFLTTLLTKYLGDKHTKFTAEARCYTVVPNTLRVLVSQRRRWINSTVHNLFELFVLENLRGVFCFSMRFVVFLDLISTFSLPASIVYLVYLLYVFFTQTAMLSTFVIIVLAIVYATQFMLFVVKREYSFLMYMILFVVSTPLWYLVLPLYAFWHFDDFKWGSTRRLAKPNSVQV